jgi:peptide/nickel transport system substrate-binding protein
MLRGIRWQLFALLTAVVLFAVALIVRNGSVTPSNVTADTPPPLAVTATPSPQPTSALAPAETPVQPVAAAPLDDVITYREALIGEIQRLNPVYANLNPLDRDITSLIFEGLVRLDAQGQLMPGLAERWQISNDGLEYVFYLRQGIAWHDGIPFTSADVSYTMAILRDPGFTGMEELGAFWRTVETEALDTFIVRFRLTQPLSTFLDRLRIGILPEHALRGTAAADLAAHPFNLAPVGTGAYQLENIQVEGERIRSISLRVAPVYRARPEGRNQAFALERVQFEIVGSFDQAVAALTTGAVDAFAARDRNERRALFDASNSFDIQLINGFEPTIGMVIFNWGNESSRFFRDQRVRFGLDTGLDRSVLVERIMINTALRADSALVPGFWAYAPTVPRPAFNPAMAAQLLQSGFNRLAQDAEPTPTPEVTDPSITPTAAPTTLFTFAIMTPNDPILLALANEIAAQWSRLNLSVSIDAVDVETYRTRLDSGDFQAALVEYTFFGSAEPDLYGFWHQGQYPDGLNYGSADDRRISEILERIRREPFGVNRARDYAAFQGEFAERAIALPLYYPLYTYGMSRRIDDAQLGYLSTPSDRFITIGDWHKR